MSLSPVKGWETSVNNPFVNRIKIANESANDADLDDLTVYHKNVLWKENYESTTLEAQQSVWTNNDGSWPTAESVGTYASRLYLFDNQCNNSTKWFCAASKNRSRQTTAYYFFASAYTGKAYQFDAKLNMNIGNNSSDYESRLYFMNGAKARNNEAPSNYLFYIGVNSSGKVYLSNGTDSDVSTIGTINGTENISNTVMEETKNYKSTGWFDASCIIDMESGTAYLTITRNSSTETKSVNFKSGTKQLSGIGVLDGAKTGGVVAMDDVALYELTYPAFTLSDNSKIAPAGGSRTVSVTDITGTISGVSSGNASVATASYDAGTVTINGVAKGNTTITVTGTNDGLTIQKTIDVEVRTYSEFYEEAKEEYGTKIDALDAAGQTYWESNTSSSGVTDEASYNAAVDALPSTYIAAVKAQGAGSDMTDAMPSALTDWTCSQGNGPGTYATTFTETYSDGTNKPKFVAGDIMSQTISGLPAGYYRVQFYGVVNSAWSVSDISETTSNLVQAYANSTTADIDVYAQTACTPTDYLRTIEAEVTESGTLTYGLKAKDGVTDAGNWAVAKIYSLTYLGTGKNDYTINAVAGETTIKQLSTGEAWASDDYGTYVPYVILYNSKYYVLDDNSTYYKSFTMGASDATKEVSYTLDESIAAFVEGESMAYVGHSYFGTLTDRADASNGRAVTVYTASNGGGARTSQVAGKGIYNISVAFVTWGANTEDFDLEYSTDGTNYSLIKSFNLTSGPLTISANVELPSASNIQLMNKTAATPRHSIDYVLIRKLNVNDDPVIVGDINYATASNGAISSDITLKKGETKVVTFQNHGQNTEKNWKINVKEGETWKANVRADSWDETADATTKVSYKVSKDGGSSKVNLDWSEYQADMADARCVATLAYGLDGTLAITTTSTGAANGYIYYVDQDVTGLTSDLTINLSVNESWLEVLSVEQTAVSGTITPAGWASFSSSYPLDLSTISGGTAYYASAASGSTVTLKETSATVPANEGLMIKGTANATFTINVAASGTAIDGNLLKGQTTTSEVAASTSGAYHYVFGYKKPAEVVTEYGFYNLATATTVPAGKAYLETTEELTSDSNAPILFSFDDNEITGVKAIDNGQLTIDNYYNLAGQRVAQPTKGIYIVNGKKYVVK